MKIVNYLYYNWHQIYSTKIIDRMLVIFNYLIHLNSMKNLYLPHLHSKKFPNLKYCLNIAYYYYFKLIHQ